MRDETASPPVLTVVRGEPTAEDLAAVVAALAARATTAKASPPLARRTAWNDPARLVRTPVQARQGGWRASGLPTS